MSFDSAKEKALKKMLSNDKSNKGFVDTKIKSLIEHINSLKNYYTTSSCSGRIIIIQIPKTGSKKDADFLFRTHEEANSKELIDTVNNISNVDGDVWLRQEPAILHVATKTLDDASNVLRIARRVGFKRNGVFEIKKRVLIELVSTERIDAILIINGKLLVSEDYLNVLVEEANKKLRKTWLKIFELEKSLYV
ncbi:hypothetical protein CMO90_04130 [Candidatus Woesearchaeota archaeon]|nr:hypothetical protein [Candidatus Woesearchaeota archaeon]|tara:strand:- start:228 stop:806 length:579 start_codon:yes stop_codon:yes gene_type:complete